MVETDRRFESIQGLLNQRGRATRRTQQGGSPQDPEPSDRQPEDPVAGRSVDEIGPAAQLPRLRSRRDPSTKVDPRQSTEGATGAGERLIAQPEQRQNTRPGSRGGTRRVAVRLPAQLHAALVDRVDRDESSQGHVVLDAIEHLFASGSLKDVIARTMPVPSGDGMFDRTRLRGRAEASVPVELRLRASALEQVDRLAAENGAESRTQLIVAALAAYLGHSDAGDATSTQVPDAPGERALRTV